MTLGEFRQLTRDLPDSLPLVTFNGMDERVTVDLVEIKKLKCWDDLGVWHWTDDHDATDVLCID